MRTALARLLRGQFLVITGKILETCLPRAIFLLRSDEHRLIDASTGGNLRSNLITSNSAQLRKYFFFFERKVGRGGGNRGKVEKSGRRESLFRAAE